MTLSAGLEIGTANAGVSMNAGGVGSQGTGATQGSGGTMSFSSGLQQLLAALGQPVGPLVSDAAASGAQVQKLPQAAAASNPSTALPGTQDSVASNAIPNQIDLLKALREITRPASVDAGTRSAVSTMSTSLNDRGGERAKGPKAVQANAAQGAATAGLTESAQADALAASLSMQTPLTAPTAQTQSGNHVPIAADAATGSAVVGTNYETEAGVAGALAGQTKLAGGPTASTGIVPEGSGVKAAKPAAPSTEKAFSAGAEFPAASAMQAQHSDASQTVTRAAHEAGATHLSAQSAHATSGGTTRNEFHGTATQVPAQTANPTATTSIAEGESASVSATGDHVAKQVSNSPVLVEDHSETAVSDAGAAISQAAAENAASAGNHSDKNASNSNSAHTDVATAARAVRGAAANATTEHAASHAVQGSTAAIHTDPAVTHVVSNAGNDSLNPAWMRDAAISGASGKLNGAGESAPSGTNATGSHDAFAALDSEKSMPQPTWGRPSARQLEAGYLDPSLGWVGVRAEATANGIHAALVPGSAQAAEALAGHASGVSQYLAEQHGTTATVTVDSPTWNQQGNGTNGQPMGQGNAPDQSGEQTRSFGSAATSDATRTSVAAASASQQPATTSTARAGSSISLIA